MPSPMLMLFLSRIVFVGFSQTTTFTRADTPLYACTVTVAEPALTPLICVPLTATYFLLLVERLSVVSHTSPSVFTTVAGMSTTRPLMTLIVPAI